MKRKRLGRRPQRPARPRSSHSAARTKSAPLGSYWLPMLLITRDRCISWLKKETGDETTRYLVEHVVFVVDQLTDPDHFGLWHLMDALGDIDKWLERFVRAQKNEAHGLSAAKGNTIAIGIAQRLRRHVRKCARVASVLYPVPPAPGKGRPSDRALAYIAACLRKAGLPSVEIASLIEHGGKPSASLDSYKKRLRSARCFEAFVPGLVEFSLTRGRGKMP